MAPPFGYFLGGAADDVLVLCEDDDLEPVRHAAQDAQRRFCALLVERHEDVVDRAREGIAGNRMAFEGSQGQRQVKLVASALTEVLGYQKRWKQTSEAINV